MSYVIYTQWYLSLHDVKIMMFAWSRLIRGLGTNFPDKKRRKIKRKIKYNKKEVPGSPAVFLLIDTRRSQS